MSRQKKKTSENVCPMLLSRSDGNSGLLKTRRCYYNILLLVNVTGKTKKKKNRGKFFKCRFRIHDCLGPFINIAFAQKS